MARAVAAEKAKRGMYEMSSEELNERLKTGEDRFGAKAPSLLSFISRVTRLIWRSDRHAVTVGDVTYLPLTAAVDMSITPAKRHGFERWWPDDAPTEDLVPLKK